MNENLNSDDGENPDLEMGTKNVTVFKLVNGVVGLGSGHYSDSPLLRRPIIPTAHFSDNPLFRQKWSKVV